MLSHNHLYLSQVAQVFCQHTKLLKCRLCHYQLSYIERENVLSHASVHTYHERAASSVELTSSSTCFSSCLYFKCLSHLELLHVKGKVCICQLLLPQKRLLRKCITLTHTHPHSHDDIFFQESLLNNLPSKLVRCGRTVIELTAANS